MSKKMLTVPTGQFGRCWAGRAKITGIYWIFWINGREMDGFSKGERGFIGFVGLMKRADEFPGK